MNSEQIERFRNAMKEQFLNVDLVDELCDLAQRGLASGEPVAKPMAYACIVDGAFHGAYRHELTAILAALEDAEELHAMQLAAICTASLSNSRNSAPPIEITHPYWTPAYGDVVAAVQREIACRERAEEAERKLADAHDAARREAAGYCRTMADIYRQQGNHQHAAAVQMAAQDILARLGQPVEGA